jgi:glyoxylate reductase
MSYVNTNAKPRVLVTRRWPAAVEARLSDRFDATFPRTDTPLGAAQAREALTHFDAVVPTSADRFGPEAFDVARPQARILSNSGVATAHICEASARERGVAVTNTPDVVSECTADLAMTLLLSVARKTAEGERRLRDGAYDGSATHLTGTKVSGKTLGLVGFGSVGREMARRAHHGFGMQVLVHDTRDLSPETLAAFGARQAESLDALLPQADFVSLHCPGGRANRNLVNGRRLDLMREGAFLINTASADLVDDHALTQALMFETIGGAAIDVADGAPRLTPTLLECDNLVVTPHLASATHEARAAMGFRVLDNLSDFFEGRDPRDRVI